MPRYERVALILSLIVTVIAIAAAGLWLSGAVTRYQHVPLDHDEGVHAAPPVVLAADLRAGDLGSFARHTVAQSFYPFVFSWLAAPVVLAFGASALVLRTFNVVLLLVAAALAWGIAAELAQAHRWLAGLLAAGLTLASAPLLVNSAHIYLDPAGLVFTLLTLYAYTRLTAAETTSRAPITPVLTGVLLAVTFLTKYPFGLFLVAGIGLAEALRNRAAGRWRPTRAQWLMGGTAAVIAVIWALLPGVLAGMRDYTGAHAPNAPFLSVENWLYYPRLLVTSYTVSPGLGWLVLLAAVYALFQRGDRRLRAWALYLWAGILILIWRRALEPRFAHTVLPAAFVIAGAVAAQAVEGLRRALRPAPAGAKAERVLNISLGALLQADVELKVRRVWAETQWGRGVSLAGMVIVAGALLAGAGRAWSRRVATYDILLPLTYKTDALAVGGSGAVVQPAEDGAPAVYDFIGRNIQAPARVAVFYGWLELSEPALRWELVRRAWDAGRPVDVETAGFYHGEITPENVQSVHDSVAEFGADYVVTYVDARVGGPHWEFNQYAAAMRDDLQLVASAVYTPTIIEDPEFVLWLFENRELTDEDIAGRLQGFSKPWPHYVDIYRYAPAGFADDPLPDLTGYFDTPDEARNFDLPDPQVAVNADFGGWVRLLGYDLEREGGTAVFTFYWQAERWTPVAYHAFLHVAEAAGQPPLAGQDIVPRENGGYPMTWWAPGEVVSDTLPVDISGLAPGEYVIGTGLYNFDTGERPAATDANGIVYEDGWLPLADGYSP